MVWLGTRGTHAHLRLFIKVRVPLPKLTLLCISDFTQTQANRGCNSHAYDKYSKSGASIKWSKSSSIRHTRSRTSQTVFDTRSSGWRRLAERCQCLLNTLHQNSLSCLNFGLSWINWHGRSSVGVSGSYWRTHVYAEYMYTDSGAQTTTSDVRMRLDVMWRWRVCACNMIVQWLVWYDSYVNALIN